MNALRRLTRLDRRGMTLIEVMLAVAILATLMALTSGLIAASFRYRRSTLDKFDRYREVQQAMERMSREIGAAFVTNVGQEATNDRHEITYQTIFEGHDDELNFTAFAHLRTRTDELASEQCEISYRIETQDGEDGKSHRNLVRREDAPIDANPDEGGVMYALLRDVESVEFEYWDPTREIADEAWVAQWDAINDHEGHLPARVKITIQIKHPLNERVELEFSTQAQVMLQDPLVILPTDLAAALADYRNLALGEDCTDGVDNNGDGAVDCDDEACLEDPACEDNQ
ncbi:MAG: prepilin-type N-terminal cleavage/methylation domain-containing protein [Myxococcales bacterium]|nr:prepilin-type N-terminal cleavage/methylation domain-containing protein [Myxococcales bacterium]MCB9520049.1 prepilin-type N-terminal cleavage/methylation domain-containing protein [Myxococcales bacterium]